jgi:hypothetical protein
MEDVLDPGSHPRLQPIRESLPLVERMVVMPAAVHPKRTRAV